MEMNKKSGGGDVRAEALAWDDEWDKAKNVFFGFISLAPTVGCFAPYSHPSPPEEKAASRKKSRLRRKKSRLQHTGKYRVRRQMQVGIPPLQWIAFLGVCRRHYMAEGRSYRFVGLVRIWTKIGRFFGPKAK